MTPYYGYLRLLAAIGAEPYQEEPSRSRRGHDPEPVWGMYQGVPRRLCRTCRLPVLHGPKRGWFHDRRAA